MTLLVGWTQIDAYLVEPSAERGGDSTWTNEADRRQRAFNLQWFPFNGDRLCLLYTSDAADE